MVFLSFDSVVYGCSQLHAGCGCFQVVTNGSSTAINAHPRLVQTTIQTNNKRVFTPIYATTNGIVRPCLIRYVSCGANQLELATILRSTTSGVSQRPLTTGYIYGCVNINRTDSTIHVPAMIHGAPIIPIILFY